MPEISVIVPVYNTEKYLDRCIRSIIDQTFSDFELILVDDGSKDNSGFICDEWEKKDSRIKVIHQKNAGAGAARNAGLAIAQGKYIGFVDSDNWIELNMYEVLHNMIKKCSADMAMVKMITCKRYKKPSIHDYHGYSYDIKDRREMLEHFFRIHGEDASIIDIGPKLINKEVLKGFQFIEGTICEDVFASFDFIRHSFKTVMVDAPLYNYFQNPLGVTKSKVSEKDFEYIEAYKRILEIVKNDYPDFGYYAKLNYLRSNFTVLSKMKIYGYDNENIVLRKRKKSLKRTVRNNFWTLIRWNMPLNRKILLLLVCL